MPEQRYRTLHAPAAAGDLVDENERRYQTLLKRMEEMRTEMQRRALQSEREISELKRRNRELEEQSEANYRQLVKRMEELRQENQELNRQLKNINSFLTWLAPLCSQLL